MKRAISVFALSLTLFVWALFPSGCSLFEGKSPEVVAVNASDAAKISVEAALSAWNDYIPVGKPSLQKQAQVRDAWKKYKAAQIVLLDAAITYKQTETADAQTRLNVAALGATATLADLINLIRTFGAKI